MSSLTEVINKLGSLLGYLTEPPWSYVGILTLIALIVLWVIYAYRKNTQGIIPFKTQGGTIEIAPSTLRGNMQHAVSNVEGVEKASCHHFLKSRRVGVKVAIHLQANSRLKDVEAQIKQCVKATLFEQFGMENIEPIHIRVSKIVGDPIARETSIYRDEFPEDQADLIDMDDGDERPYADETKV